MGLVDTHAHIMFSQFDKDREEVVERAKKAGVSKIINVGCDPNSCNEAVGMSSLYDDVYATLGYHPYDSKFVSEELMAKWEELIKNNKKIVAIGECGLDYFKAKEDKEIQKKAFRLQLGLAKKTGLPVIVHNRNADEESLEILKEYEGIKAVFHCFGSNSEFANKVWAAGFLTSFTGTITFPTAHDLHQVVAEVPMDMFMVETDCPFLAPQKFRGQRNEPAYVVEVAKEVAKLKGKSFEEIEKASNETVEWFFGSL